MSGYLHSGQTQIQADMAPADERARLEALGKQALAESFAHTTRWRAMNPQGPSRCVDADLRLVPRRGLPTGAPIWLAPPVPWWRKAWVWLFGLRRLP